DTGGVSSAVAAIDIVASDHRADEFLRDVVQLVRRFRATEHAERLRIPIAKTLGHGIERLIPGSGTKRAVLADHRLREPVIRWNHKDSPFIVTLPLSVRLRHPGSISPGFRKNYVFTF